MGTNLSLRICFYLRLMLGIDKKKRIYLHRPVVHFKMESSILISNYLFGCSEDKANNYDGTTTINNNESSRPIFLRPSASSSASVSTIPHRNYLSNTGSGDKIVDAWFHRR